MLRDEERSCMRVMGDVKLCFVNLGTSASVPALGQTFVATSLTAYVS